MNGDGSGQREAPISTSVGYRSFAPDLEARLALLLSGASPVKAELGVGVETPDKHLLPAKLTVGTTAFPSIDRNLQLSAGAIVNLTARWRARLEITRCESHALNHHTSRSDQIELGTLLAL